MPAPSQNGKVRSSASQKPKGPLSTPAAHPKTTGTETQRKPALTVPNPELAFSVLSPSTATNSDTLATHFGYFAGWANPHVHTWIRSRALEILFKFVRRVPKYSARKTFGFYALLELWRRWRGGDFDQYDSSEGGLDSWGAAIASLPGISEKGKEPYSMFLRKWMRCWHIDSFFDWIVGFSNERSLDDYSQRSTTVTEYEGYLDDPLQYDPNAKTTINDCWLWDPEEHGEVDQIAGLYASIKLTGQGPRPPNKTGRPRKSATSTPSACPTPPARRPSPDIPSTVPTSDAATPSPYPDFTPSPYPDVDNTPFEAATPNVEEPFMPAADKKLFDKMVEFDFLSPFAVDNASATLEHLRALRISPSQLGLGPEALSHERCVRVMVYPKQATQADESFIANIVLWSATGPLHGGCAPTTWTFAAELVDSFAQRPPMDLSNYQAHYELYPLSLLADLDLGLLGMEETSPEMLRKCLNDARSLGMGDLYAIQDLGTYGL